MIRRLMQLVALTGAALYAYKRLRPRPKTTPAVGEGAEADGGRDSWGERVADAASTARRVVQIPVERVRTLVGDDKQEDASAAEPESSVKPEVKSGSDPITAPKADSEAKAEAPVASDTKTVAMPHGATTTAAKPETESAVKPQAKAENKADATAGEKPQSQSSSVAASVAPQQPIANADAKPAATPASAKVNPPPAEPEKKVKGYVRTTGEKIYHLPGDPAYDHTNPEEWFDTAEEAEAAGFRRAGK